MLLWASMIFVWYSNAQSSILLNEAPRYSIHELYQWTIQSWSTNKEISWRDGYCSLIARKNQEQLATLVWSTMLPLRWHAMDLIQLGRQEPWRFRQWDQYQLKDYLLTIPDWVLDMYSFTIDEHNNISNPEEVSYRSPHRFTLIKYQWTMLVLDPLRGDKSTDPQELSSYLQMVSKDHYFIIPKNIIPFTASKVNEKPAMIYSQSLLTSLLMHHIQWHSKPLQWAKSDEVSWIVFNKPFQYLNEQWDSLTIHKGTIVWLNDLRYWPLTTRVFERVPGDEPTLFHSWDRFSQDRSLKIYDGS